MRAKSALGMPIPSERRSLWLRPPSDAGLDVDEGEETVDVEVEVGVAGSDTDEDPVTSLTRMKYHE